MELLHRFSKGKTRLILGWPFVFLAGYWSREFPAWPGVFLCFMGATLRFWASGHIRKDVRPAVGGPYAYTRNPLYLGTYCMALGIALSIHSWTLFILATLLFVGVYHFVILDEEIKLRQIFKGTYEDYCKVVPRFFPVKGKAHRSLLLHINPESKQHNFSFATAMHNKAYEAYVTFIGILSFLILMASFWQR